jgi:hypothetical protein
MTRYEFNQVKLGDIVEISMHGFNKGKKGIIRDIKRDPDGDTRLVYLEPLECEFVFGKGTIKPLRMKDGLYPWNNRGINYLKQPHGKTFYIAEMFGAEGVSWSAENFTETELKVIDRFLTELDDHICGRTVESIVILNEDID